MMGSNELGETQPSNSNTSYSHSPPPYSPQVYVYDDNKPYYAYYHRSPVDYPPTPDILEHTHEDTTPPSPPLYDTLPHSPPHNLPYDLPSSSGNNYSTHGFSPYDGHTQGDSPTVFVNNDNEAVVDTSYGEGFCPPHAAVFYCNICMEMTKEPVVTSCGHLYCWPCLYNWLYFHSNNNKCPVCNGEVNHSMITPIYGQGTYNDGNSTVMVPPRPCGGRFS